MGSDPSRQRPFFFSKPSDAVVPNGSAIPYPSATTELHHEVELVVALGSGGTNLSKEEALSCVFGFAVGIDLTRRDMQAAAKQAGRPWDLSKGFDQSAPLGPITPSLPPIQGEIALMVNGDHRQQGDIAQMIWSVPEIIGELSIFVELRGGDLIFTGTPSGVGQLRQGDRMSARLSGAEPLEIAIV